MEHQQFLFEVEDYELPYPTILKRGKFRSVSFPLATWWAFFEENALKGRLQNGVDYAIDDSSIVVRFETCWRAHWDFGLSFGTMPKAQGSILRLFKRLGSILEYDGQTYCLLAREKVYEQSTMTWEEYLEWFVPKGSIPCPMDEELPRIFGRIPLRRGWVARLQATPTKATSLMNNVLGSFNQSVGPTRKSSLYVGNGAILLQRESAFPIFFGSLVGFLQVVLIFAATN